MYVSRLGEPGPGSKPEPEIATGHMCRVGGGPREARQSLKGTAMAVASWRHPEGQTGSALINMDFTGNQAQKLLGRVKAGGDSCHRDCTPASYSVNGGVLG